MIVVQAGRRRRPSAALMDAAAYEAYVESEAK